MEKNARTHSPGNMQASRTIRGHGATAWMFPNSSPLTSTASLTIAPTAPFACRTTITLSSSATSGSSRSTGPGNHDIPGQPSFVQSPNFRESLKITMRAGKAWPGRPQGCWAGGLLPLAACIVCGCSSGHRPIVSERTGRVRRYRPCAPTPGPSPSPGRSGPDSS